MSANDNDALKLASEHTEVKKIDLDPRDILVIRVKQPLPREAVEHLRAAVRLAMNDPHRQVLVLDAGLDLAVLHPSEHDMKAMG